MEAALDLRGGLGFTVESFGFLGGLGCRSGLWVCLAVKTR